MGGEEEACRKRGAGSRVGQASEQAGVHRGGAAIAGAARGSGSWRAARPRRGLGTLLRHSLQHVPHAVEPSASDGLTRSRTERYPRCYMRIQLELSHFLGSYTTRPSMRCASNGGLLRGDPSRAF
jgi:hypothetical protein